MNARPSLLLVTSLVLASSASAQVTFSIDDRSPTLTDIPPGVMRPITSGDILAPIGGQPQFPPSGAQLQTPEILLGVGNTPGLGGSLGLSSADACIGVPPGMRCQAEVDALTFGNDDMVEDFGSFTGISPSLEKGHWHFSVDEWAEGNVGPGVDPTTESENRTTISALVPRGGDTCADIFVNLEFTAAPPLSPLDPVAGNIGVTDGNGLPSITSYTAYPGLGLKEPNSPVIPGGPNPGDNLDALDCDGPVFPATSFPVYYSLDSAVFDPKNGTSNAGTAGANGFSGSDVIVTPSSGATPSVYAAAALLGLDQEGIDTDDLDALLLAENGIPGYQPSLTPYDWLTGTTDMLLFSVRRGSNIVNNPMFVDSIFGVEIEPGDILVPPVMGGNGNPGVFIAAEVLGLKTVRMLDPCGDDLDALDYKIEDRLIYQEYCYGDGGVPIPGTGSICRPCPCGNDMPPGTQAGCMNSSGTGAHLQVSGLASVSADSLRFEVTGASPSTFGLLTHGAVRLPQMGLCAGTGLSQPTQLDGLRCIGQTVRAGTRPTSSSGSIGIVTPGWGPPNGPPSGLISQGGLISCQVRQFMVIYRDDPMHVCNNGLNTTNGVQVTITP